MTVNSLSEKELLRRISQNDEKAFKEVFDLYKERFYAAALKMTRSQDDAEEIVQEVFVTLWLRRSVLAEVDNPASYLLTIVYNSISVRFRKIALERKMKEKLTERLPQSECNTEEIIEEKENQQLLQNILQCLPDQQQLIYKLSKEDGLSRNEIAAQLHISPNTVKNHLLKAMKYIRTHWNKALTLII